MIAGNSAERAGGVYIDYSQGNLKNNIIAGNESSVTAAGIYIHRSRSVVSNNTIVANTGTGEGIEVYIYSSDRPIPIIVNNIIVGNAYGVVGSGGNLSYNDVYSNSVADYHNGVTPGPGSISVDPLFVSGPRGEYYLSQVAAGQAVTSPCADAGSDTAANLGLDDRTTRTDDVADSGTVDMGYHYPITGGFPALTVIKQANPDPVQAGEQLTYTIYVTNTGELDLHATITDILPAHTMPTGVLTWTPTITAPGGVWTQPVAVSAETNYEGPLVNVLWVTTEEGATAIHIETSDVVAAHPDIPLHDIYLPLVLREF